MGDFLEASDRRTSRAFYKRLVDSGLALLSKETNLDRLLQEVVALALDVAQADAGSLYVIRGQQLEFKVARNLTLEEKKLPLQLEHHLIPVNANTICGYVAASGETLFLDDVTRLDPQLPFRFNQAFDRQLGYRSQSMLVLPLTNAAGGVVGVLQLINHRGREQFTRFPASLLNPLRIMARQAGLALNNAILGEELKQAQVETVYRLGLAAEIRDQETGRHLQRVSHYAQILARSAGQSAEFQDLVFTAAPLHDVGKIGLPDSILLKAGPLTEAERAVIKTHTTLGHQILSGSQSNLLRIGASIALTHHEKWDGSGYPRGLRGEAIPLEGRLVALADVFDALTTRRPYKAAWEIDQVEALLRAERGRHFDPALHDRFLSVWPEIMEIARKFGG